MRSAASSRRVFPLAGDRSRARSPAALALLSLCALAGCEDGPTQLYQPAPAGAASLVNDGKTPPSVDSAAMQGYVEPDGGTSTGVNAEMICSTPERKQRINTALHQPIIPPRFACGIDLAGGDRYQGITIEEVEKGYQRVDFTVDSRYPAVIDTEAAGYPNATVATAASRYKGNDPGDAKDVTRLCQGDNFGEIFGGENTTAWGDNQECFANYSITTHKLVSVWQTPGYLGAMTCYSRPGAHYESDGAHVYTVPMSARVLKDGQSLDFSTDWSTDKTNPESFLNELYDACLYSFAPFIAPEDGVLAGDPRPLGSAAASGHLEIDAFVDGSVAWYAPSLGFGFGVASITAGPETATIPNVFQMYRTKTLGFSTASLRMKLDLEGPVGLQKVLGSHVDAAGQPIPCRIAMGLTYGDFIANCVAVTGDDAKNQTEINKLLGGKTNGRERYFLDVQGIDVSFSEVNLPPEDILHDGDLPSDDDYASSISWDQSALGNIANDFVDDEPDGLSAVRDYHGAGLVWLEMARLAQAGIQALRTDVCADASKCGATQAPLRTLGDPACLGDNVKPDGKGSFQYPQGCTGLEGFVTAAPPLDQVPPGEPYLDAVALGPVAASKSVAGGALGVGLRPGQPRSVFCNKLGGKTPGACTPATGGLVDSLFAGSFRRVLAVYAGGDVSRLPADVKDARYFFKAYFRALVKYLIASGQGTETTEAVHAVVLDQDALFFDSQGAGQFESGEYVDRRFVAQTGVPMDIQVTADVKNGILNDYDFGRELYRGEEVMYDAMLDRSQPDSVFGGHGDDVLLSNVFGSVALHRTWGPSPGCSVKGGTSCGAKYKRPSDAAGIPVLGDDGKPLLAGYQGAILSTSPFALGYHTVSGTAVDPATGKSVSVSTQIGTEMTVMPRAFPGLSADLRYPLRHNPYDQSYFQPADLGEDPSAPPVDPSDPASPRPHLFRMIPTYDETQNRSVTKLVPFLAKMPGVGFSIPVNGQLDKFISTAQLDLSGTTITANVDLDDDPTLDPLSHAPVAGAQVIKAVETADFLGLVFLCRDDDSAEVLTARMYDPAAAILDWIDSHPVAAMNCDFVVRFSPYGNFPDFITTRQNGVTLSITQGGGFGRVVDVTLYDPDTSY